MKCTNCENKKELKRQIISHKYKECGLYNVTLNNITLYRCDECGEEYYNYGDIDKLHQKIADLLITKSDILTGAEIRFLRKYLGYSGAIFASILAYSHESLSRIENGQQKVTETFDHLVRFAIANKAIDRNYKLHDLILNKSGKKLTRINLQQADGEWKEVA